jgi:hypothetical protein
MINKFKRNFTLLCEDIVNPFKIFLNNYKSSKDSWMIRNKKEVLLLYRHFIKNIPVMQNNLFEQRRVYEVILV